MKVVLELPAQGALDDVWDEVSFPGGRVRERSCLAATSRWRSVVPATSVTPVTPPSVAAVGGASHLGHGLDMLRLSATSRGNT